MKVLVTGGNGWIGKAVCVQLGKRGHEFVTFDRYPGPYAALTNTPLDIRDERQVYGAVSGVDHVIHLAGLLGTHELFDRVHEAVEVNVLGSVNITDACSKYDVGLTTITMPRVNPSLYAATKSCEIGRAHV